MTLVHANIGSVTVYKLCFYVAGRCTARSVFTTAHLARQTYFLAGVPNVLFTPHSSPSTRLWSPCNQAHFMTIKAGNVVVKVRRSLCSLFSCHISSGFHNLVKYFSHFFRKEKYSMDDFFQTNYALNERLPYFENRIIIYWLNELLLEISLIS